MQKVQMLEVQVTPLNGGAFATGHGEAVAAAIVAKLQDAYPVCLTVPDVMPPLDERGHVTLLVPKYAYWLTSGATGLADVVADALLAADVAGVVRVAEVLGVLPG